MTDTERVYGLKPVFPEKNYDRTHHQEPPISQQYTALGQNRADGQADRVTWEKNEKHLAAVHGHTHPKNGAVKPGTAKMLTDYGLGPLTFYKTKVQTVTKLAFDSQRNPIMTVNSKGEEVQAEVEVKATSGEQARALEGLLHVIDPLNDATFDAKLAFISPDLIVTRYQERQVQATRKYGDVRYLPPTGGWHPKTSGNTISAGEKLRSELGAAL